MFRSKELCGHCGSLRYRFCVDSFLYRKERKEPQRSQSKKYFFFNLTHPTPPQRSQSKKSKEVL
jgi:hypothetical protein